MSDNRMDTWTDDIHPGPIRDALDECARAWVRVTNCVGGPDCMKVPGDPVTQKALELWNKALAGLTAACRSSGRISSPCSGAGRLKSPKRVAACVRDAERIEREREQYERKRALDTARRRAAGAKPRALTGT